MPLTITNHNIATYLESISASRKHDMLALIAMMKTVSQREPKLWGSIVGFGKLYYRYQTGHDGYMPILGLANRKQAITLYLSFDFEHYPERKILGKHKAGKSCLYIQKLSDIDLRVLTTIMQKSYKESLEYPFVKVLE